MQHDSPHGWLRFLLLCYPDSIINSRTPFSVGPSAFAGDFSFCKPALDLIGGLSYSCLESCHYTNSLRIVFYNKELTQPKRPHIVIPAKAGIHSVPYQPRPLGGGANARYALSFPVLRPLSSPGFIGQPPWVVQFYFFFL